MQPSRLRRVPRHQSQLGGRPAAYARKERRVRQTISHLGDPQALFTLEERFCGVFTRGYKPLPNVAEGIIRSSTSGCLNLWASSACQQH